MASGLPQSRVLLLVKTTSQGHILSALLRATGKQTSDTKKKDKRHKVKTEEENKHAPILGSVE